MKILILKPSSLGDVIHALPVLRLLKLHFPKSEIFWWLDSGLVPLLENDPDLSGIIPFQRKGWGNPRFWPVLAATLRDVRARRFDWAIDLQGLARSSLFAWLANADLTVGLDNEREGGREGARAAYDIAPPRAPADMHAVDRYLAVLPLLNVPVHRNFHWLPPRPQIAAQVNAKWNTAGSRWVILLPGGRWDNKRWPSMNYIALVKLMLRDGDLKFAILGSKDEQPLGQAIAATDPKRCLNLAGSTSLAEMVEWIRLSELVVTNDTGPMHVAAAIGRPIIAIFGPTKPASTGPYGQLGHVLQDTSLYCVPCLSQVCSHPEPLACLHAITPQAVYNKIQNVLDCPSGGLRVE